MQLEFFEIPSPCVGVCQSDAKGHCLGCMRTREERLSWLEFDADEKQKVIKRCQQRKKRKDGKLKEKVEEQQALEVEQPSLLDPPSSPKVEHSDDLDFGDFEL